MLVSRLLLITLLFNRWMCLYQNKNNDSLLLYNLNDDFLYNGLNLVLKGDDISPGVIGLIGGAIVAIIAVVILWIVCKNKSSQPEEKKVDKVENQEALNQVENSLDHSKAKLSNKNKEELSKMKNAKESLNDINKEIEIEKEKNKNSSERKLVTMTPLEENVPVTQLEIKEQKISKLFQSFSSKLNDKYNSEQDKHEFFKPISLAKTEKTDAISSFSKVSKKTANPNQDNVNDAVCYTNQKRDSPTNSFYDKKMDEINQIQQLALEIEEDKLTQLKKVAEKKVETPILEVKTPDEDEEDEEDYESVYKEKDNSRNQLEPDEDDIISDFHEKTKNVKIELFKKNTQDFDKESMERNKNKKSEIFVYVESKVKNKR